MEPLNDLWQGGEKTKIKKFGTKITFKIGRTLSEEEREQDQLTRKKRREDGEMIIAREEKIENEKKRGEEARSRERECFHHTLVDDDKPAGKPGETKKNFETTWEARNNKN